MRDAEDICKSVKQPLDIQAIATLKARYCQLVDGQQYDDLAELFTEDATCDYDFMGSYKGRDEIMKKFFRELLQSATSFMAHTVHHPVIEVNGDAATGAWYLTAKARLRPSSQAVWVLGVYRDGFKRVAGQWKISALTFRYWYFTPYERDWAKSSGSGNLFT
jgi:ketosteroid isomerase-like protein